MRILWFTWRDRAHPLSGGAETVNEEIAERLVADGDEVTFIVGGFEGGRGEEVRGGSKLRIVRVGGTYTVYPAAFLHYLRHFRGWPDLVIDECNTMPFFAGWYTRRPTVLFFHMLCREIWFFQFRQPFSSLGWLAEPIYLRLLPRAPVVAVSDSTRRDLARHGFREDAVRVISQGVELEPVADLDTVRKFPEPTLLSLGAMRAMKRTIDQVRAYELARERLPGLRLLLAGDSSGSYGGAVRRYVEASPHRAGIRLLGRVGRDEKAELMRRAHLVLMTSVKEGWGLVVSEAASQGTPAVVYDVDGLRDSVRDDQTGVICHRNTPADLADGVVGLLSDEARYARLRRCGWDWSRTLTFDRSYADFRSLISRVVAA